MSRPSREQIFFAIIALVGAFIITRGLVGRPAYPDSYYYFNAGNRLVSGEGLTDPYLWTYISAPDSLPTASHRYWMPLPSLLAALGMGLLNAPGDFAAAQLPFTLAFAGTVYVGYWLGGRIGGTRRHAWIAGLLTLLSGFFVRYWGQTDTFTPFALAGSLSLAFLGLAQSSRRRLLWLALSGMFAVFGHLTRADGLLLLMVGWVVIIWPGQKNRLAGLVTITLAYLLVMSPWFIRNLNAVGSPLPLGGAQGIWFLDYNEIFNYPADSILQTAFAEGIGPFLAVRWEAFVNNLGTFIAVEGLVIMAPLMLIGLWRRCADAFLRGFWIYALGLHLVMTLVFPLPGYRGGLFHSAAALVPWWAALGVVGLDDVIDWLARHRRHWQPRTAKRMFSAGLIALALALTLSGWNRVESGTPGLYRDLMATLPDNARVMINDPAGLYYFTGLSGVVLPNEAPDVIPEIAQRYGVTYLVLEGVTPDGAASSATPPSLWPILTDPPDFLEAIPFNNAKVRVYAIHPEIP